MIKQTQTKLFRSSDVGLDFCAGSIIRFPEVFKKILVTGFNPQIVNSVSISGSTITLTYGVTHGYVADRVLQVTASGGFNKEVYIDSVNGNNVICTVLDGSTTGLTGTINTKIASAGWDIVYEVGNIHIYKMKHFDETDRFVRMCFQTNTAQRNAVAVCIGKTYDSATGFITDEHSYTASRNVMLPFAAGVVWNTFYDGNYNNNASGTFGNAAVIVASPYHLGFSMTERDSQNIFGIFPKSTHDYPQLDYPVLVSQYSGENIPNSANFARWGNANNAIHIGNIRFEHILTLPSSSYLPSSLDEFNTTTLQPYPLIEINTGQQLGYMYGLFHVQYASNNRPAFNRFSTPFFSMDVDFESLIAVMASTIESYGTHVDYVAFVVEEIKHGI